MHQTIIPLKKLKKIFKILGFVLLVALASIGLGINAAMSPPLKRHDDYEPLTEMVETKEEDEESEDTEEGIT